MSVVTTKLSHSAESALDYQLHGVKGSKGWRKHMAQGTDRAAGYRSDLSGPEEFVAMAEQIQRDHVRKIQIHSLIQSFAADEFDPSDELDVQRVTNLGYMFAKELHPHSDVMVITHLDGHGGHPHNHISVINHDRSTGNSIRNKHLARVARTVNDRVMEREGARVLPPQRTCAEEKARRMDWEARREDADLPEFDKRLGDAVMAATEDLRSVDTDSFREVLTEHGVELTEKNYAKDGEEPAIGWTYKMRDTTGAGKPRLRRRAASKLSNEFTHDEVHEVFAFNQQQLRERLLLEQLEKEGLEDDHGSVIGAPQGGSTEGSGRLSGEFVREAERDEGGSGFDLEDFNRRLGALSAQEQDRGQRDEAESGHAVRASRTGHDPGNPGSAREAERASQESGRARIKRTPRTGEARVGGEAADERARKLEWKKQSEQLLAKYSRRGRDEDDGLSL